MDVNMTTNQDWQVNKVCIKDRFRELLLHSRWTDCSFRVGENNVEIIHGHKLVLAASSPVFEALFYGPFGNPSETIIDIPDIEPHIFNLFMRYIYSDVLNLQSIEEAGGLLYMSKKYFLYQLEHRCITYLVDHTWIKTLWDVLAIAELLNNNELLKSCLKVMCRNSYEIWGSDEDHFSGSTLCDLLMEKHMNMEEIELWKVAFDWAKKQCQVNEVEETPSNLRSALDNVGALSKLRLLSLRHADLKTIADSGLLTEKELKKLEQGEAPPGFCPEYFPRHRLVPVAWRCNRDFNLKTHVWLNRGEVVTQISSTSRVLVTGFELFTQICTITDYMRTNADYSYREKFIIFIKDSDGKILSKTDHDSNAEFNQTQIVSLSRPFWFESFTKYTVQIGVLSGRYPVSKFTESSSKGTTFEFRDTTYINENTCLPCGLIVSVLYSL